MKKPREWNRETVQEMHREGIEDRQIGEMFGKTALEVSRARKRSSYWEVGESEGSPPQDDEAKDAPTDLPPVDEAKSGKKPK